MSCFVAGDANEGTVLSEVGLESVTREVAFVGTSRNKCPVCAALGKFRFGCSVERRNNHGISSSRTLKLYTQICLSHPPVVESSFYLTCLFHAASRAPFTSSLCRLCIGAEIFHADYYVQ